MLPLPSRANVFKNNCTQPIYPKFITWAWQYLATLAIPRRRNGPGTRVLGLEFFGRLMAHPLMLYKSMARHHFPQ